MREIKFRAWDVDGESMFYTKDLWSDDHMWTIEPEGIKLLTLQTIDRIDAGGHNQTEEFLSPNQILMQYTGLKDKNGKEIYEGDIVRQKFMEFETGEVTIESTRGTVVGSSPIWPHDCQVIGNIYENPELLTPTV